MSFGACYQGTLKKWNSHFYACSCFRETLPRVWSTSGPQKTSEQKGTMLTGQKACNLQRAEWDPFACECKYENGTLPPDKSRQYRFTLLLAASSGMVPSSVRNSGCAYSQKSTVEGIGSFWGDAAVQPTRQKGKRTCVASCCRSTEVH